MRPFFALKAEQYFEFERLGTNWRTEILAGFTTFVTMAYIIFVNPSILAEAGMPHAAVVAATCFSAGFGSLLMGAFARYPIALAPGMGLNAYFTYTVVKAMGVSWQTALGAVFLSGVAFLLLTAAGVRQLILEAIPSELYASVAVGIGLFIALIGFRNAGLVAASPATLVTLGDLRNPQTQLALFGLLLMASLMAWEFRGAMLIGVLATTAAGAGLGLVAWQPQALSLGDITGTAFQLDVRGALRLGLLEIVFVFLFVDLFDNIGTLVGVGKKAGLFDRASRIPRVNRILFADATATVAGSLAGTSTVVSYIESAAGVAAGGRSGVTAIVTGLLFLVSLLIAPLVGAIPAAATAPALILVGALMISHAAEIRWSDPLIAIPAFLTITAIPLTFSIANGLAFGFTAHTLLRLARGEFRTISWLVYLLTALFLIRFIYLGAG
ncbi:MAG: NCS2 family permease [Bryobacteraceae bacterium]|nr:NCS2 family permease [Bryobacteraceae bacterium]